MKNLAIGVLGQNNNLNINSNATLKLESSLKINLPLNSGATLEFVDEKSTIYVYGEARIIDDAEVIGNFTDTSNKL